MLAWLLSRLREPTTYLGLAALVTGGGQLAKVNEAPAIADAISNVGVAVSSGVDPLTAGLLAVAGVAGVFLKEKGGS